MYGQGVANRYDFIFAEGRPAHALLSKNPKEIIEADMVDAFIPYMKSE